MIDPLTTTATSNFYVPARARAAVSLTRLSASASCSLDFDTSSPTLESAFTIESRSSAGSYFVRCAAAVTI
jgi:hypothetical protein